MAPEAEARTGQREAAPDGFRHGRIGRRTVTAPVSRELLSSHGRRTGEQHGFPCSSLLFQKLEYGLIIEKRIVIVHLNRIGTVKISDILHRDSLTEIRLKAVYAHIQQRL